VTGGCSGDTFAQTGVDISRPSREWSKTNREPKPNGTTRWVDEVKILSNDPAAVVSDLAMALPHEIVQASGGKRIQA